jgi:hypothetical protein
MDIIEPRKDKASRWFSWRLKGWAFITAEA